MRLKFFPFLISLALLSILISFLPILLANLQAPVSVCGAIVGLFPGFGLGLIFSICSIEGETSSRDLLSVLVAPLLSMIMAVLCWSFASFVSTKPLLLALSYGAVNMIGALALFALVRKLYDTKLSNRRVLPAAYAGAMSALVLLFFPLTLFTHGIISAAWVSCVGIGIVLICGRRKRNAQA